MIEWLMNNKEWIFSGIGVLIITALVTILSSIYHKAIVKSTKYDKDITVNIRAKSAPKIIIKAEKRKCKIYEPERYSDINSWRDIKNYSILQQLVDELDIQLVNVGSEYAKNVNIVFKINKEDCLLSDKNIFWLYESLLLENYKKDQVEQLYFQEYNIPVMEANERIRLPLNMTLNGIIISCMFNTSYFINFSKEEFSKNSDIYEKMANNLPLKLPVLFAEISYSEDNGAIHKEKYELRFNHEYMQLGDHLGISFDLKL